jgi:hypothetical protein
MFLLAVFYGRLPHHSPLSFQKNLEKNFEKNFEKSKKSQSCPQKKKISL